MNKIICSIPFFGKKYYKKQIAKEAKEEEDKSKAGKIYENFSDFLKECPKYCIDNTAIGRLKRDILRSMGIRLQAYVFIDKSSTDDAIAWLPQNEKILYHEKGTYLKPWDSEKDIIYFDINDMRPLIDKTKDVDWYNQEACSEVVTSITNSKSMASMNGNSDQTKILYILIAGIALAILISVVGIYTSIENQKQTIAVLQSINQSIPR